MSFSPKRDLKLPSIGSSTSGLEKTFDKAKEIATRMKKSKELRFLDNEKKKVSILPYAETLFSP